MKKILIALIFTSVFSVSAFANKAAKTLNVDTAMSSVLWKGSKPFVPGGGHNGTVKIKSGQLELVNDEVVKGNFVIDMTSIANDDLKAKPDMQKKLVGHLNSDDFFAVGKNPTATYEITSIRKGVKRGENGTHTVDGTLTIRGNSKPLSIPATIEIKDGQGTAKASFSIDRMNWGVTYNHEGLGLVEGAEKLAKDKIISNKIELTLNIVAK